MDAAEDNSAAKQCVKPLVHWMVDGDPDLVPVMMCDGRSLAASHFGVPLLKKGTSASFTSGVTSAITADMITQCSKETGVHVLGEIGCATPLDVIEFIDDIDITVTERIDDDGTVYRFTTIQTPKGDLSDVFVTPANMPACWKEHLVKDETDLPAFAYLIERASETATTNNLLREKITTRFQTEAEKWPADIPLFAILGIPTFSILSNMYMGPAEALYLLADHTDLFERLFEVEAKTNFVFAECAATAGVDFMRGSINGLELFSPEIYERYFIPQARALYEFIHARNMKGWIHTCGYKRELISMGVYKKMDVDVLETLSHPPLGDVADLRKARAELGSDIVTRGAVNVDLFYEKDLDIIQNRCKTVVQETRGYRHMIGDSNDSFPPYPMDNIRALVDEVQKSGRLLPA